MGGNQASVSKIKSDIYVELYGTESGLRKGDIRGAAEETKREHRHLA